MLSLLERETFLFANYSEKKIKGKILNSTNRLTRKL